jgi:hypothetical protein
MKDYKMKNLNAFFKLSSQCYQIVSSSSLLRVVYILFYKYASFHL